MSHIYYLRKLTWKIGAGILVLLTFYMLIMGNNFLKTLPKTEKIDEYKYLVSLPAPFVDDCKVAGSSSGIPWELIAAYYQVLLDEKHLSTYPDHQGIDNLVRYIRKASETQTLQEIFTAKLNNQELVRLINTRFKLLKEHSTLFSKNHYLFPIREADIFYKDTWGADRDKGERFHQGTDIFAKEGTPIYTITDGTIERIGWNNLGGKRIGIRGQDGIYYYYAHLKDFAPGLKAKDSIKKGTFIGTVGRTGNAINTPPHLHLGLDISNNNENTWINPYNLLNYWQNFDKRP